MHLRYDYYKAHDLGEMRHAQEVMRGLGISYQHSTPQTMADQWWFWNCDAVPDSLPPFITVMNNDPHSCVGYGLSADMADSIANYKPKEKGCTVKIASIGMSMECAILVYLLDMTTHRTTELRLMTASERVLI